VHLGAVHEVGDPQLVDMIHFKGFAHIGAGIHGQPALGGDEAQKRIVVHGGLTEQALIGCNPILWQSFFKEVKRINFFVL
jgi:hypothetical protein